MNDQIQIEQLKAMAETIVALLKPYAEVVIHDINSNRIIYIANSFSGRSEGDPSLLDPSLLDSIKDEDVIGPYEKAGDRGQQIRSITSVIKNEKDSPLFLVCINLDFSVLESALDVLDAFVRQPVSGDRLEFLFRKDWRQAIKSEARSFVVKTGKDLYKLDARARYSLVKRLHERGLFYARRSAEQVADLLKVSRATIYNDLAKVKKGRE